jgi:hypothetical protein
MYIFLYGADANFWIGAKRRPENVNEFVSNYGSVIDYDNFGEGFPTLETRRGCVMMESELSKQFSNISDLDQRAVNGEWRDMTCNMPNLVLCQKLQSWSLPQLQ